MLKAVLESPVCNTYFNWREGTKEKRLLATHGRAKVENRLGAAFIITKSVEPLIGFSLSIFVKHRFFYDN